MSLLIVSTAAQGATPPDSSTEAMALAEAHRQGFHSPQSFSWAQGTLRWFATPNNARGSGAFVHEGDRCAACVGTFHWRGLTGEDALRGLLARQARPQDLPLDEISGSFAMLMASAAGVWLFGDPIGLQKIYETAGATLRSTSMMVCRAAMRRPRVNRLRAQEYVLLGATHALQTPLEGLDLMDPTVAINLDTGAQVPLYRPDRLRSESKFADPAAAVDAVSAVIADEFKHIGHAFGPNIGMALSGGFDSRLLLAALDHAGVQPHLFVYGRADDPDVVIARSVAARLGAPIVCTDKADAERSLPALTADKLRANFDFLDGLPVDGVFDRGADQATRLLQVQGGRLNLNGGGGEILRNFFYLRDRPYTAADIVAAFYTGWLDDVFHTRDERDTFLLALQDRVLESLGRDFGTRTARAQRLHRSEVELVYTLFRLRYWMGRNNSVSTRYGAFMTPLVTPRLVAMAASIPMAWKDHGRLEAQVIQRLSPRVASGPSAYGFDFSLGPDWRHRLNVTLTMIRPVALRHQSLRVRKALGRAHAAAAPAEWCAAANDAPRADWLNPLAICDLAQINRLMTLQAFVRGDALGSAPPAPKSRQ